jgi:hypothetical protein
MFSKGVSSVDQDVDFTEQDQQQLRAYDAFSLLARTKKSWQRLGHLVELAADHTITDRDSAKITSASSGRSIADVGTDHGLLDSPCTLVGRDKC